MLASRKPLFTSSFSSSDTPFWSQVVQPLRQPTVQPLGCGWGAQAQQQSLVSLCVVLVSTVCTRCTQPHVSACLLTLSPKLCWVSVAAAAASRCLLCTAALPGLNSLQLLVAMLLGGNVIGGRRLHVLLACLSFS